MKNIYSNKIFAGIILISFCLTSSCTKTWITDPDYPDYQEMFVSMWNDINDHYIFFDQKNVDWSNVKTTYESEFNQELTREAAFEIYTKALKELEDGHVSLFAPFETWHNHDLYLDYPENFNEEIVNSHYLFSVDSTGPFRYDILDDNIGYVRYASFGDDIETEHLRNLMEKMTNTKGMIIDIRNNFGGAADNVNRFLSIMVNEDTHAGQVWTKDNGVLESDAYFIVKNEEVPSYQGEIIILTNRRCYSSANVFAGFASQLPNVTLIGDTTLGGTGLAVGREMLNGWQYRFSGGKITLADGSEFEEGVLPDVVASTGDNEAETGKDGILEVALEILR